ncbi:MAG: enoyl-CoA hydratase-related protein [Azospira sp.]|jgi:2-(1,2-epoxy-1,2-dihydrophenyl)acetyl-CoA isomerase|nr:enoyl-CoA hydratase-related protein [Azospira sp.]
MSNETVLYEVHEHVARLTLNRPKSLNALNLDMIEALRLSTARAEVDPEVRAILVTGAGEHFMAGGDLKWFREQLALPPQERQPLLERCIAEAHQTPQQLRRCGKPVVVAVRGAVAGFGLSLMLAADLALAADDAYFTLAYCNIALSPDGGATWSLPRAVGMKRAAEIALLGDRFDAQQALAWGLVNRVVAAAELLPQAEKLAARLAAGPAEALASTKRLLNASFETTLTEQLHAEQRAFAACGVNPDFAEGLAAFFEKRPARF